MATLLLITIFILLFVLTSFWVLDLTPFVTARFSNVKIGLGEYILFRFKKLNYRRLTKALILSEKAKLNIDKTKIILMEESHSNSLNIISLLVAAKNVGIDFPLSAAIKGDIAGVNYAVELKKSTDRKTTISLLQKKFDNP